MGSWPYRPHLRLTAGARLLALLAIGGPILWTRDLDAVVALGAVVVVWLLAQVAASLPRLWRLADPTIEAALVGVICGVSLHSTLAVTAALLPLAAHAQGGFAAFVETVKAEARRAGIREGTLQAAFAGVEPNQRVI